ncbi:hypothetical protein N9878_00930 [bacterium]|nr:hypothetical protein [bacterium]
MTDRTVGQAGIDAQIALEGVADSISPTSQANTTLQPILNGAVMGDEAAQGLVTKKTSISVDLATLPLNLDILDCGDAAGDITITLRDKADYIERKSVQVKNQDGTVNDVIVRASVTDGNAILETIEADETYSFFFDPDQIDWVLTHDRGAVRRVLPANPYANLAAIQWSSVGRGKYVVTANNDGTAAGWDGLPVTVLDEMLVGAIPYTGLIDVDGGPVYELRYRASSSFDATYSSAGRVVTISGADHASALAAGWAVVGLQNDVILGEQFTAESIAATQFPIALDTPTQIEFGIAQNTVDDAAQLAADGTITFNQSGIYRVDISVQYGKPSGAGESTYFLYGTVNPTGGALPVDDLPAGRVFHVTLDNDKTETFGFATNHQLEVQAGWLLKYWIVTDSAGVLDGGLTQSVPSFTHFGNAMQPSNTAGVSVFQVLRQ